jgi:hypothetical protein
LLEHDSLNPHQPDREITVRDDANRLALKRAIVVPLALERATKVRNFTSSRELLQLMKKSHVVISRRSSALPPHTPASPETDALAA